jgi:hypothetical protein
VDAVPVDVDLLRNHRLHEIGVAVDALNYSYGWTPSPSTSSSSEIIAFMK